MEQPISNTKWIVVGVLVVVLLILLAILNPFVVVSAGERGIVLTWGAVSDKVLEEGIHWRTPIVQSVKVIDVKVQKEQVAASAASKDLQSVVSEIALNYHLAPESVNKLWQNVGSDYKERVIDPAIQEAIKSATAQFTAEELITKRQEARELTKVALAERLAKEYIIVDDLSIVNFSFSASFNDAIEAKVTAEQNALASKNKLEQVKFEAEQRVTTAKAEAEAIRIQAQAITQQGGAEYVNLKAVEKWNGILPVYMLGGSMPLVNLK